MRKGKTSDKKENNIDLTLIILVAIAGMIVSIEYLFAR